MLSPNSIPSKRTGRASSTWSIDSGYGSGIHEDVKLGFIVSAVHQRLLSVTSTERCQLDTRDITSGSVIQHPHQQPIGLGIDELTELQLRDDIVIKNEDHSFEPSTPRLRVCTAISNPSTPDPISPASPSEVRRSHARKSTSKLPSQAVGRLNAWLDANRHHPYPNANTKQALAEACSITIKQVTTWFTNTRQRQLKSQENGTGGVGSEHSHTPTQASRKGKKKDYGRSNGASPIEGFLSPPRLSPCASMSENSSGEGDNWQCTFCRVPLTAKSWRRHEETQHHPKHQWTCLATGPSIQLPSCSSSICAFCELQNPDEDHFRFFHRIGDCLCKDANERTFGRPDHLQQHARNFHKCTHSLTELVRDTWRRDGPGMLDNKSWTCGFCHEILHTWDARATHISGHFKAGLTMAQWRESRVSQSTLPREPINSEEPAALDALASMGTTIPGPSTYQQPPTNYGHNGPAHALAPFAPVTTGPSDLNFDPFVMYGNEIDTFTPPTTGPLTSFSLSTTMPTIAHSNETPFMDLSCMEFDEYGNPVWDHGVLNSW
ncbi:hypothetical protein BU25DRAFT_39019 [Macroventuria anomochaeta]|uniref:Uncharacterized protein n=1 Tax=Macroventuria anomochaeta TaxID=301207 RepID=A0ACB6S1A2_9PLEO|nr:uncharacterized protein BU25DRAFT_39019 [Macroventuria anomochaeta]KAF2628056.1 hypothetical protein BU25DRAFT_39019 [Macroventuria anomochaeta]